MSYDYWQTVGGQETAHFIQQIGRVAPDINDHLQALIKLKEKDIALREAEIKLQCTINGLDPAEFLPGSLGQERSL